MKIYLHKILNLWARMIVVFCLSLLSTSFMLSISGATLKYTIGKIVLLIVVAFTILLILAFIMTLAESKRSSNT